jgi:GH35 family endo-1,4-beta-xylanase
MGISVWGIIDKFSWMELGLWAVPNAQDHNVPATLFLYTVKKFGGE